MPAATLLCTKPFNYRNQCIIHGRQNNSASSQNAKWFGLKRKVQKKKSLQLERHYLCDVGRWRPGFITRAGGGRGGGGVDSIIERDDKLRKLIQDACKTVVGGWRMRKRRNSRTYETQEPSQMGENQSSRTKGEHSDEARDYIWQADLLVANLRWRWDHPIEVTDLSKSTKGNYDSAECRPSRHERGKQRIREFSAKTDIYKIEEKISKKILDHSSVDEDTEYYMRMSGEAQNQLEENLQHAHYSEEKDTGLNKKYNNVEFFSVVIDDSMDFSEDRMELLHAPSPLAVNATTWSLSTEFLIQELRLSSWYQSLAILRIKNPNHGKGRWVYSVENSS
ncbi:putative serine/threonine-protein phosphatase 2A 65 kDa regulatory subunit A beta isoform-like [Capsicum annuum]|nr:putative serine/threonine-protein phosphatase 2A 65 kDa regulatory subunit A beta isoform-like [Capsicum annuum]